MKQSGLKEKESTHAKGRDTGLRLSNQYDIDNLTLPPAKILQMERHVTLSIPETTQSREWPEKPRAWSNVAIASGIPPMMKSRAGKTKRGIVQRQPRIC